MSRLAALLALGIPAFFVTPRDGSAQAWLPLEGEATVSTSFQRVIADGHFLEDGSRLPGYRTRASNFVFEMAYGMTERLAIGFTAPFVSVRYAGPEEPFNLPDNVIDDGTYHGSITDLRFEVRYNALDGPFVLTPVFTVSIPSHSYDTLGESAPGRNFQEYRVGAYVGRLLDPVLPRAFVHSSYAYAFVRQNLDIPLNYSSVSLETGYFVTPTVAVSFLWRGLWTHGGLSFNELFEAPPDVFVNLDRVVRVRSHHLGVGASFPVTDSVSAHANFVKFVSGVDAHYGGSFSVGLSWTFQTRATPIVFGSAGGGAHDALRGAQPSVF